MKIEINEDNLKKDEIDETRVKVRALLFDDSNRVLIFNYGNVYILPGGKVDGNEFLGNALVRELNEEIGQEYSQDELDYIATIKFYQRDYPKREGFNINRLVTTCYFVGPYKGIEQDERQLSENEIKDNLKLELVPLDELEKLVLNNISNNPRDKYFQKELLSILRIYEIIKAKEKAAKIEKLRKINLREEDDR